MLGANLGSLLHGDVSVMAKTPMQFRAKCIQISIDEKNNRKTAVSRASLIFQKKIQMLLTLKEGTYIASTACTWSHLATTKQNIII